MNEHARIPVPSNEERRASIRRVLDRGLAPARPAWRTLPLSALVFGVEDCLFLSVILALAPAALVFAPAGQLAEHLGALVFFTSPMLYAAAHALTMWKESLCGTLDWKRTCRLSLQTLTALRMLLFGGAAVLVCVPVNLLLWWSSGGEPSLVRVLGTSFSSLFLYAGLSLACRDLRRGPVVPITLWSLLSAYFFRPEAVLQLERVPTAVFFLLAGGGLLLCAGQLRAMLRRPNKGGFIYAFR